MQYQIVPFVLQVINTLKTDIDIFYFVAMLSLYSVKWSPWGPKINVRLRQ
jgi:hypothetical protein